MSVFAGLLQEAHGMLQHAKRAWFAGRLSDDGESLGEYPLAEFNAKQEAFSALLVRLGQEHERDRGWPHVAFGLVAHSPVDTYRCENDECGADTVAVWQFRPDDYDLDESAVLCPECGVEGVLFYRYFRGQER